MPITNPTQKFVPIKEIREGVVILNDGSLRAILMASSLNFALKSEDNQQAILFQFQNFLNSLDFSVQIFIQSKKLDIRPYLQQLEERFKEQKSDLLKIQTREYIEFIKSFTESTNIMAKSFFLVIPYSPTMIQNKDILGKIGIGKKDFDEAEENMKRFNDNKIGLEQRVSVVQDGLLQTGVRTARLGTEETIELFYKIFNPGELDKAMLFE